MVTTLGASVTDAPDILFADRRALVVNKPPGLPVYPGRAGGASVEDFFPSWRRGGQGPWLVHRLDQDTAGCLLVALKKSFLLESQALMTSGAAEKFYWARVRGVPAAEGVIEAPLAKLTIGRRWHMAVQADGQAAKTSWRVIGQAQGDALVEFRLHSGRTHQVRAHAAHLGHAVAGDPVYGDGAGPMCLLARALHVPVHPPVAATAPPPPHMRDFVEACGAEI